MDIATVDFVLGSATNLRGVKTRTYEGALVAAAAAAVAVGASDSASGETKDAAWSLLEQALKMRQFHLTASVTGEGTRIPRNRVLCLTYLLCIDHHMRTTSSMLAARALYSWIQVESASPERWVPTDLKKVSVASPFPVLGINVKVKLRKNPFVVVRTKFLSVFPSDMDAAVHEFFRTMNPFLCETVGAADLEYAREGVASLVQHWEHSILPGAGFPRPAPPFLFNWDH